MTNAYGAVTSSVAPLCVARLNSGGARSGADRHGLAGRGGCGRRAGLRGGCGPGHYELDGPLDQTAASSTNLWLCYRKTFSLPSQPASAVARIATDSKYWLWVNGHMAVREGNSSAHRTRMTLGMIKLTWRRCCTPVIRSWCCRGILAKVVSAIRTAARQGFCSR